MYLRPIFLLYFTIVIHACILAQGVDSITVSSNAYHAFGWRYQMGKVIAHTEGVKNLKNTYPLALELNYNWLITDKNKTSLYRGYPKIGTSLTYWGLDDPVHLGYSLTGMITLETYYGLQNKLSFSYKCGFGMSYQNLPFHPKENPDNNAFSTNVAFPLLLGAGANMWLSKKMLLNVNVNFNHISNGGFKTPNLGLNWASVSIGIDHYFETPSVQKKEVQDWRTLGDPKNRMDLIVFSGFKELALSEYYCIPGFELKGSHQFARINALTLGLEYVYDRAMSANYKTQSDVDNFNKLSGAIGHEFLLGRFIFSQQFGIYLYNPYHKHSNTYQRFGLTYFITPHIKAGINLKTYQEEAQFIDARIGYSFHQ